MMVSYLECVGGDFGAGLVETASVLNVDHPFVLVLRASSTLAALESAKCEAEQQNGSFDSITPALLRYS